MNSAGVSLQTLYPLASYCYNIVTNTENSNVIFVLKKSLSSLLQRVLLGIDIDIKNNADG